MRTVTEEKMKGLHSEIFVIDFYEETFHPKILDNRHFHISKMSISFSLIHEIKHHIVTVPE
jgi:hypothetical protein